MGRKPTGWQLRQRAPGRTFTVRFWVEGRESERSTGTSDPDEAAKQAARIYAAAVQAGTRKRPRAAGTGLDLEELLAEWLVALSSTHDPGTCTTWELYATTHWVPHFVATHNLTTPMAEEYMRARLLVVRGETVRKELSALRQFLAWASGKGYLPETEVPGVPKRAIGTAYKKRRRGAAIELSPDETLALIAALPEWSTSKKVARFPIQARFRVAYETSLRPSAVDLLEAPTNYRKGSSTILLTPELDKSRWGRELPLSHAARAALDAVCPAEGLIFGKHDYRQHLKAAAKLALTPERAERFCGAHLRSARVTHWLEETGNLPGTQYLAGHKQTSTTARYVRPSLRAAMAVVAGSASAAKKSKRARAR